MKNKRLPSKQEILHVFAACVVPVYSWSIFVFLWKMPSWLNFLNLDFWSLASILAYALAFALLESVVLLLGLVLLAAVFPQRLFRDRFVAQSGVIILLTTGWAIVLQRPEVAAWTLKPLLLSAVVYLILVVVSCVLVYRYKRLEKAMDALVERLTVFLYIYIPASFLGVIVVILRNI